MPPLRKGTRLSERFHLIARIGAGGMGEVWMARDNELKEKVALKVLNPELAARGHLIELLKHECRSSRRLIHPNIVCVYDFHRVDGQVFISMEYIAGRDLNQLKGASYRTILQAVFPVLDALAYAHELGIVHRDVKASNIILDMAGTPHLVDFGIAAALHGDGDGPVVRSGGSPLSMSPQQSAGEPPQPADDLYACGALLYELFFGRPPLFAATAHAEITFGSPVDSPKNPALPQALEQIVLSLLATDPADRPPSMRALKASLEPFSITDANATIPPWPHVDAQPRPRREAIERTLTPPPMPPVMTPTSPAPSAEGGQHPRKTVSALATVVGLLCLLAVVIGVFFFLPEFTVDRHARPLEDGNDSAPTRVAEGETPTTRAAPDSGQARPTEARKDRAPDAPPEANPLAVARDRQAAEEALAEFLRKHAALEAKAISLWGETEYAKAQSKATQGDEALRKQTYQIAVQRYREAIAILTRLESRTEAVLLETLEAGESALTTGDGVGAQSAFMRALAIDPQNPSAKHGLERAKNIEEVFRLLASGAAHEREDRWYFAHTDFEAAAKLDPDSAPAQTALARIKQKIADHKFQSAMSEGLEALHRKDYHNALKAFRVARAFKPNSPEVSDGISQATEGMRLARIAALRNKAVTLEEQERWVEALAEYVAALAIDPTLLFAREGKARSLRFARLNTQLTHYLDKPSLLASRHIHEKAKALLEEASAIEPKGPKLTAQLATLREQVELAGTPLMVRFLSDDATEVAIYKVGKLGQFKARQLALRPGTYTIVGSRPGYKDVRRRLTLAAGEQAPTVFIACEERI